MTCIPQPSPTVSTSMGYSGARGYLVYSICRVDNTTWYCALLTAISVPHNSAVLASLFSSLHYQAPSPQAHDFILKIHTSENVFTDVSSWPSRTVLITQLICFCGGGCPLFDLPRRSSYVWGATDRTRDKTPGPDCISSKPSSTYSVRIAKADLRSYCFPSLPLVSARRG